MRCVGSGLQAPVGLPRWARRELPLGSRRRGARIGTGARMGKGARRLPGVPRPRLPPRTDFSPCPASRCGYCLSHSWNHCQPHYCLRHLRFSHPEQPPPPSFLLLRLSPLLLVRSRLAGADGVTCRAESIGISLADARLPAEVAAGLPELVVIRSSSHQLPPTRAAGVSRLLRGGEGSGRRHRGAAPSSPGGSQARIPPDRAVTPADVSEAEATPEAGAAGNRKLGLRDGLESPPPQM